MPTTLRERLSPDIGGLVGPSASAVRQASDNSARRLLESPQLQGAFADAAAGAQHQLVAILNVTTPLR